MTVFPVRPALPLPSQVRTHDRIRARTDAAAFALSLARALARDVGLARDVDLACDLAGDLVRDLDYALDLARKLGVDADFNLDLAQSLARNLARALVRARDLVRDLRGSPDLSLAFGLARNLASNLDSVCHAAYRLGELEPDESVARAEAVAGVMPSEVAARLAYGAVRALPTRARGRYRQEFDSELYELAAAGASRWTQMVYGLRLVDRAWVLRAELREAARGKTTRP